MCSCFNFYVAQSMVYILMLSIFLQDIALAKGLSALSPSTQDAQTIGLSHGVDLILGGHDHLYYVSKGVNSWGNFNVLEPVLGAEDDHGDVLVVKSGTDFRDLSEITLELDATLAGSVRKRRIKRITGKQSLDPVLLED